MAQNDNKSLYSYSSDQTLQNRAFNMIENYVYLYHLQQFVVIPTFPESITDSMEAAFNPSTPMSRSAPIYSYSHSGPRTMQINLDLHRDMMSIINRNVSNLIVPVGDDYVDTLIANLQACALPAYNVTKKLVDPPMVAVRFGNDIFIKGVIMGAVSVSYGLPILENDKYARVSISFNVYEVDPYSAQQVAKVGSFRGLDSTLERSLYKAPTAITLTGLNR